MCKQKNIGSSSYITDANGEVAQHLEYFAFGETFVEEHSNKDRTPYLYNAKELDEETGLYYYGARYYDPVSSVWMGVDPPILDGRYLGSNPNELINNGVFQSKNLGVYTYTYNNPIVLRDENGKWPTPDTLLDLAFIVYDLGEITYSVLTTGKADPISVAALSADVAALAVPLATGAGVAVRAGTEATEQVIKHGDEVVEAVDRASDAGKKTYQTYTKKNPKTGEIYTGRTSGTNSPRKNVANRDKNHHMNETHERAVLDKSSTNKDAIRGREQQVIDANGGAKSTGGTSGNAINGISKTNPKSQQYQDATKREFGTGE